MYGPWNDGSPAATSDVPTRPAPTATLPNTSPVWKRRRVSEGNQGRRASKTTRACDACKAKKARCSGMKPCTTCAEKNIECSYDSQYLRGRPPTPPSSTPEASTGDHSTLDPRPAAVPATTERHKLPLRHQQSSPEPESSDIHGQYIDPTCGLSFLQRAQYRLKRQTSGGSASNPERWNQPLTTAGDKPLLGATRDGSNAGYNTHPLANLPSGANATELMELYFDVCISTYKPLHRPTVELWYHIATNNIANGLPISQGLGHAEASILLSIFAIATFHRQKSRGYADDVSSLSESDFFFRHSLSFTETEIGVAHLESAQARMLQAFYLLMTSRTNQAWYVFGSLLQIISALGMHRRDWKRTTTPQPDYIHSQCRKRTFWSAYILDRYLGVVMGRPRHFHDDDIDQELPDCVNDLEMSPAGRMSSETPEDCHMDAFVWNVKLSRTVGRISHSLYPITPLSEARRVELTRSLGKELDAWQSSLPPFLSTVKPSSLVRSFRRQCIALRMAYDHAVMHLYRPFLLSHTNRRSTPESDSTEVFRQQSVQLCIAAAQDALRTVDAFASDGPLFHAFWWTHYITFCALTVVYVWNTQQPSIEIEGVDRQKLMMLSEQCQVYLAQATATNSPSRRYSIILEELRSESLKEYSYSMPEMHQMPQIEPQEIPMGTPQMTMNPAVSLPFSSPSLVQTNIETSNPQEIKNPFMNWQTSDWLEIDASAYALRHSDYNLFCFDNHIREPLGRGGLVKNSTTSDSAVIVASDSEHISSLTNYCAFVDPRGNECIGHFDVATDTIQPLAFKSGTHIDNLYQVIEVGDDNIIPSGEPIPRSSIRLLPPISGRDILCVGKNYAEHAKEFNQSGFDSSDKKDQPTHPVIFTKRYTSIIADGDDILPHHEFTQTLEYEGEIGVIIGKQGFRISEDEAMDYVWGYTIIDDLTARERQRDHKQFYIGKSADTFCPMGPIAVPANRLDKVLRVQTHVNGELRQDATTEDLIFSIPYLLKTMSEGQTLMPGDVLATGTPAGVGLGRTPPTYLKPGDEVTISVSGLGRLSNRVAPLNAQNTTSARYHKSALHPVPSTNQHGLELFGKKHLHVKRSGTKSGPPAIFIHGLGGSTEYWRPLIELTGLKAYDCILFDLEGHGLSPTTPTSRLSIESFAADLQAICLHNGITSGLTLVAQSLGCLVALKYAQNNPGLVSKLVLFGPPPNPLPKVVSKELYARANLVRSQGMGAVIDTVASEETSQATQSSNLLALSAVRLSLLTQSAEGYAKACTALAEMTVGSDLDQVDAETLIITGADDRLAPPQISEGYKERLTKLVGVEALGGVGHWHVLEDAVGVSKALSDFL